MAQQVRLLIPKAPHPVLVTGATGFLGRYLVHSLLADGKPVRALGRNLAIGLELSAAGADFRPVDLRDRAGMLRVCQGAGWVVHCGALSSAWGKYRDFYDINVIGTENVIAGCLTHGVQRLVYISSPSVMSRHEVQLDLDESHPLPEEFVSLYSKTKALAEARVNQAGREGLPIVILRPKAIYGPGDQSTFPRIIDALATGRLPVFGEGQTDTDITHVLDVVQAIQLALTAERAVGHTYLITGGEKVNLWDIIRLVARELGYPEPKKKISLKKAMVIGSALERIWKTLPLKSEPPLTRYKVSIMSFSQTYNISAARRDLGYEPKVRWQDGVGQFLAAAKQGKVEPVFPAPPVAPVAAVQPPVQVKLTLMKAGATRAPERIFGLSSQWRRAEIPALFALLEHPKYGPVVFDTGYSTRFFTATEKMPNRLYALVTPVRVQPEEEAAAQLQRRGYAPDQIEWVIVSHFDPDHIGGLRGFPNARIICSWRAWREIAGKTGLAALRERLLPELLPEDLAARLLLLPDPAGEPIGPFPASLDLFGDGAIRLVDLPGHAAGMIGAFVRVESGSVFLCADACWTGRLVTEKNTRLGFHRWIANDKKGQDVTYGKLLKLAEQMPEIRIIPSHCPISAAGLTSNQVGDSQ